eukprot:4144670-Pleurochrysis_carterae.AAC.1
MRARERRSARCHFLLAVVEPENVAASALVVRDVGGRAFLYEVEVTDQRAVCGDFSVLQSFSVL